MKLQIIAIRDIATELYGSPAFVQTIAQGIRAFSDEVTKEGSPFAKHPQDYELWHLGEFDDNNGVFECLATPARVARGTDFVKRDYQS